MWSSILDWAFHWILLYLAFEFGRRWNEKDVAASIAAITETQSRRRSSEFETPEKGRSPNGSPTSGISPLLKEKRRLSRPLSSILDAGEGNGELRPLFMADLVTPPKTKGDVTEVVVNAYLKKE